MCGIVGAFGPSVKFITSQSQASMDVLSHRGPDGNGIWFSNDGFCFLGHRRLAILDPSGAASQPMIYDGSVLSYNGEIYNHQELRKKYFLKDKENFKTHSDTETLLHLFKRKDRKDILQQLNGMFAGAYYETSEKSLFLFRDPLGIKPLYWYTLKDSTVLFSSEIKGLFVFFPSPDLIRSDSSILKTYLTFENWPQGKSLFSGINLLRPGENLILYINENNQIEQNIEKWTHPPQRKAQKKLSLPKDYDGLVKYARTAIEESVQEHLLSDVPLSAYLSGGLDSGTVVAIASQDNKDLLTFTGYYDVKDSWYDERVFAQQTARRCKLEQVEVPIRVDDFYLYFDKLIQILEEPRMGMGSFSQMIVAKKAAEFRKVILSGHGGDEMFLGYPLFKAYLTFSQFPNLSSLKTLSSFNQKEWPWLINLLFEKISGKIHFAPLLWPNFPFKQLSEKNASQIYKEFGVSSFFNSLEKLEAYYVKTYLPGLLMVEDKISMAFSLETRTPLWSPSFLQKIQKIPPEIKLSQGRLKGLFKDAITCWLPPEVINAPKRGFPTPFRYWFRNELREEVERRLLKEGGALDDLISKEKRKKLLTSHFHIKMPFAFDEKRAHKIWMLLCLESWSRQFNIQWKFS